MSMEAAKACIAKLKTDESFRETIFSLKESEDRLRAIVDAGYPCTTEELRQVAAETVMNEDITGGAQDRDNMLSMCGLSYCFVLG